MQHFLKTRHLATAILMLGANIGLAGCSGLNSSPVDQAYYNGAGTFAAKGAYTRTIFSSNDF
jgi:hypothetical protein